MAEMIDVLNSSGKPLGRVLDKDTVHAQGLWHKDVHVWITDGHQLLQQQRAWHKSIMPGAWDISLAGHVAAGETYLDAAVRETREELGLVFPQARFRPAGTLAVDMAIGHPAWQHRTVGDNFVVVARNLTLKDITLEQNEVIGVRWYPLDQLEADLRHPETATLHAPQPLALWALGIAAVHQAIK